MRRASTLLLGLFAAATAAAAPRWAFDATLARDYTLDVSACSAAALPEVRFGSGLDRDFRVLRTARREHGALERVQGELVARDWRAGECLRTSIDLRAASHGRRGDRYARDDYVLVEPRQFLWRPAEIDADSSLALTLPDGWGASLPWPRSGDGRHRLGDAAPDFRALAAFGEFEEQALALPGGQLRLAILPPWSAAERRRAEPVARALLQAYGRLPRADAQWLLLPLAGQREAAPWGETTRGGAPAVHLFAGADAAPGALLDDWTATHELAHLLHPHLGERGRWLSEGLASYYQNVLRARVGALTADDAWRKLEEGFARGRAERRSDGLTLELASRRMGRLRNYMRVYWSGAAYWLEADVALRERGSSLDDVLREHAACCLAQVAQQQPEDYVAALDRLAGGGIFVERYRRYAAGTTFPAIADVPPAQRAAIMRPRTVDLATR